VGHGSLFETIRIEDGEIHNLKYHNNRMNRSRELEFDSYNTIDISNYLKDIPKKGLYRAKVIYAENIINTTYYIYKAKKIESFVFVESDIEYPLKYTDRSKIESLSKLHSAHYEIIIIKSDLITDTSIANIAILKDARWLTPKKPLLYGTTRARLLENGKLFEADLSIDDLYTSNGFALMNAMIGFVKIKNPIFIYKE